ncbi:MAG: YHS domain-containing (seleno)protein [Pseudomonadota bacterium]
MCTKPILAALASAVSITMATSAIADDEYNVSNGITLTGNPLGMHGVDAVSMFDGDVPTIGDAVHTSTVDGVDYYFASKASQQTFEADQAAYLPQYGGFCAFGVSLGKKLDGDVRYADIEDGKLYLFVNAAIFEKYLENKEAVLAEAAAQWPAIRNVAIEDL